MTFDQAIVTMRACEKGSGITYPCRNGYGQERWGERDAAVRVMRARFGSLDPDRVSEQYLSSLRGALADWLATVDRFVEEKRSEEG